MTPDWNAIAPTAAAWAEALERLIARARALGADAHARDTLIAELTEFIIRSPRVASELDKLAAAAIDDLLLADVSARLARLAGRSVDLGQRAGHLRAAMDQDGRDRAGTAGADD